MRDSFIFYRSFYEAIRDLPRDIQGEIYTAIMEYSLYGNETENLKPVARSIFTLIKPQIDINNKRFDNGCKGGRAKKNQNQNETKTEPNQNQNETKTEPNQNQNETKTEPNKNVNDNKKTTTNVVAKKDAAKAATLKRKSEFRQTLEPYVGVYPNDMLREFCDYWTEMNKSCTKMRFEQQPTWEIAKRLATWAKKEKQYGNNRGSYASKQEANEYAMQQYIADRERDGLDNEVEKPF